MREEDSEKIENFADVKLVVILAARWLYRDSHHETDGTYYSDGIVQDENG
jgi:hypothetical protein